MIHWFYIAPIAAIAFFAGYHLGVGWGRCDQAWKAYLSSKSELLRLKEAQAMYDANQLPKEYPIRLHDKTKFPQE